jgi:methyl-accepting chemotaxis protein
VAGFFVAVLIRISLLETLKDLPSTISRSVYEQLITDASSQVVAGSILIIFLAVIATGFLGVFFLHRVAGPVYRFGQVMKRIVHGELPNEVTLRPRDFFKDTAEDLNKIIRFLKKRDAAIQKVQDCLNDINHEVLPSEAKGKISQAQHLISQVRKP